MIYNYYLGLGSNIEPRITYLHRATSFLAQYGVIPRRSSLYQSEPWGETNQGRFLNAVIEYRIHLSPREFLALIKEIEKKVGRLPNRHWGPREIDIDILWSDHPPINEPDLEIPHPHLFQRRFVLEPLAELENQLLIGESRYDISQLLYNCPDNSRVQKLNIVW